MYYEYWNLQKPPFDNVPDPSMYAECHTSMENAIAETLFAIEEGNECLAVIIGDVGLGKTLSLRIIIDSLHPEQYQIALITNPSLSFVQLMNEIIGQLTGTQWNERKKVNLLETFNKLLFQIAENGKKTVLLIDEANAISPSNLENLRLLTNMQDDQKNLFTMVLAGQIELARRLEDPRRSNLFQRIGTYSLLEKIPTPEQVRAYVETRLRLAGATRGIFTDDAFPLFWEYSEYGVPRLINKIAKLSLKAGETYGLSMVDSRIVYQVGKQFERLTLSGSRKGKTQKASAVPMSTEPPGPVTPFPGDIEGKPSAAFSESSPDPAWSEKTASSTAEAEAAESSLPFQPRPEDVLGTHEDPSADEISIPGPPATASAPTEALPSQTTLLEGTRPQEFLIPAVSPVHSEKEEGISPAPKIVETGPPLSEEATFSEVPESFASPEEGSRLPEGILEEFQIEKFKVRVHLPAHFVARALACSQEERMKMAGEAAVQAIKKFVQATSAPLSDPVGTWSELRSNILERLKRSEAEMAA